MATMEHKQHATPTLSALAPNAAARPLTGTDRREDNLLSPLSAGSGARSLVGRFLATANDKGALVARVVLAAVMLPHGTQHALGWLGGYGFSGTFQWMTHTLGFPAPLAALAIITELLAPLALLAGVGGRLAAAGLFGLMVGAAKTHLENGFFMNWFGGLSAGTEGFEYHLLALALAAVVMVSGSGALSLDSWLSRRSLFARKNDPS